jgi:F-type H+-transporting ATPase subunit beta
MKGKITSIIGPVVDVEFAENLPAIYNALTVDNGGKMLTLEVEQHVGGNVVRAIAMDTTDGLARGQEVTDTGAPISVPVGAPVLGRMFNVLGEQIDGKEEVKKTAKLSSIHRAAPDFVDQSTKTEILETGIKVIDLICPVVKGGKVDFSEVQVSARLSSSKSSSTTSHQTTEVTLCSPVLESVLVKETTSTTK